MKRVCKKWSEEDIAFLKNVEDMDADSIAKQLGRTKAAVITRISGLRKQGYDIRLKPTEKIAARRTQKRTVYVIKRERMEKRGYLYLPERCRGCIYRRRFSGTVTWCAYFIIKGCARPCRAEKCTEKAAVREMEIKEPTAELMAAFGPYIKRKEAYDDKICR